MFTTRKHGRVVTTMVILLAIAFVATCVIYIPDSVIGQGSLLQQAITALSNLRTLQNELTTTIPELQEEVRLLGLDVLSTTLAKAHAMETIARLKRENKEAKEQIRVLSDEILEFAEEIRINDWNIAWIDAWMRDFGDSPSPSAQAEKVHYQNERVERVADGERMKADKKAKHKERGTLRAQSALRTGEIPRVTEIRDAATRRLSRIRPRLTTKTDTLNQKILQRDTLPMQIEAAEDWVRQLEAEEAAENNEGG